MLWSLQNCYMSSDGCDMQPPPPDVQTHSRSPTTSRSPQMHTGASPAHAFALRMTRVSSQNVGKLYTENYIVHKESSWFLYMHIPSMQISVRNSCKCEPLCIIPKFTQANSRITQDASKFLSAWVLVIRPGSQSPPCMSKSWIYSPKIFNIVSLFLL